MDHVFLKLEASAGHLGIAGPEGRRASFHLGDIDLSLAPAQDSEYVELQTHRVTALARASPPPTILELLHKRLAEVQALREKGKLTPTEQILCNIWVNAPSEVVEYFDLIAADLRRSTSRLVQLLRWCFNRLEPAQPLSGKDLEWSLDAKTWDVLPEEPADPILFGEEEFVELSDDALSVLQQLLTSEGIFEPILRQLYLEAVNLRDSNRREALVLAVAAAEVGVKEFASIQSKTETESWLLWEMPSPRLEDLLAHYLPLFTNVRTHTGKVIPTQLVRTLGKAITARNKTVHKRELPPSIEELAEYLAAVNDLLYALDWLAEPKHKWAFKNIREDIRSEWISGG